MGFREDGTRHGAKEIKKGAKERRRGGWFQRVEATEKGRTGGGWDEA